MSCKDDYTQSPSKRRRLSPPTDLSRPGTLPQIEAREHVDREEGRTKSLHSESNRGQDGNVTLSATSRLAGQTVAPFLAKHIPSQYAPMGADGSSGSPKRKDPNTKYCYRHRPDLKCRRQADEPSMEQLQHVSMAFRDTVDNFC